MNGMYFIFISDFPPRYQNHNREHGLKFRFIGKYELCQYKDYVANRSMPLLILCATMVLFISLNY